MENYVLTLFFLGVITTIIGYYESRQAPAPKVVYKFVDKTIEEAQKGGQESVYNMYLQMFTDPPLLV